MSVDNGGRYGIFNVIGQINLNVTNSSTIAAPGAGKHIRIKRLTINKQNNTCALNFNLTNLSTGAQISPILKFDALVDATSINAAIYDLDNLNIDLPQNVGVGRTASGVAGVGGYMVEYEIRG